MPQKFSRPARESSDLPTQPVLSLFLFWGLFLGWLLWLGVSGFIGVPAVSFPEGIFRSNRGRLVQKAWRSYTMTVGRVRVVIRFNVVRIAILIRLHVIGMIAIRFKIPAAELNEYSYEMDQPKCHHKPARCLHPPNANTLNCKGDNLNNDAKQYP